MSWQVAWGGARAAQVFAELIPGALKDISAIQTGHPVPLSVSLCAW
jgi:hypothetical protein